jgi:glutathione S-transferase
MAVATAAAASGFTAVILTQPPARSEEQRGKFHLLYFDARGIMETSRILLELAGQPYTETRYGGFKDGQFSMGAEYTTAKASNAFRANMGRLPILQLANGTQIGQSKSIERHLARKLGLYGVDEDETARIDMWCEHIRDLKDKYQAAKRTAGEADKVEAVARYFSKELPEWMAQLEVLADGENGVVGGRQLTLADVSLYVFIKEFFDAKAEAAAAVSACPKIVACIRAIEEHPRVSNYLEGRPDTPF